MTGDSVSAFERQRLAENNVVVRPICAATADLSEGKKEINYYNRSLIGI